MGVGASRAMGTGDTGGTKREGAQGARREGGVSYYLNQATGGSHTSVVLGVVKDNSNSNSNSKLLLLLLPKPATGGSIVMMTEGA